jgi:hypothetical protein
MRQLFAVLLLTLGFSAQALAQSCTNLGCQQMSCPVTGVTTTISGVVYAPNGTDPLPNVTVYIPNAPVPAFTPGVSCPVIGTPLPGSPLVGTTTGVDGTFQLQNVPVGTNIPIVAVTGRWRVQTVVPTTTACVDTPGVVINMPTDHTKGDIPKFAIATGAADQVECVLLKVGIKQSEFTNPGGGGQIEMYQGDGSPGRSGGAVIDTTTPQESTLMADPTRLDQYDVLMLPCEGGNYLRAATQLNNLILFANAGGRVYSSHFSYSWMYQNPPFNTVVNWTGTGPAVGDNLPATVDTTFSEGQTLAEWLQLVGASTTKGQISLSAVKKDFTGINKPTQSYLTLNGSGSVMQFVFDTPIPPAGTTVNQCGRVLFNEYHVENPPSSPTNVSFPNECNLTAPMTAQEKLLEFSLFELTDDGGQATLTPTSQDFGTEPVGFTSAPQTFVWTNNSTFAATVTLQTASGDFAITSPNCGNVGPGASCNITVTFTPTAIGARTGTLTIGAGAQTLTAALTGTGVTDLAVSPAGPINFGNLDVGASLSKTITITSNAPAGIPFPGVATTGDYSATTTCPSTIPALGSCTVTVTFKPQNTGSRPGTLAASSTSAAYAGVTTQLSGNGVDFTIAVSPSSGTVEAGYGLSTKATVTPIAGFAAPVTMVCTSNAAASTCVPTLVSFVPSEAVTTTVPITTTSQYTVVGFTAGNAGLLSLIALGSGWLLWIKRRSTRSLMGCALTLCLMAMAAMSFTGCGGKLPSQNSPFTAAGTYTYTVTATDGFLTHTATYSLTVTPK